MTWVQSTYPSDNHTSAVRQPAGRDRSLRIPNVSEAVQASQRARPGAQTPVIPEESPPPLSTQQTRDAP